MSRILFGIGNPLLDISANVSLDLLKQYDLKENDAILAEEKHMPLYDEISKKDDVMYIPGGATQNAIKVAQWLLKKPNSTVFSGCIHDDKYGKILKESCDKIGVHTAYQYNKTDPTGLCACLITGTNRSLVTHLGASCKFTIDHVKTPEVEKLIENAKFFYISAFFITSSHETLIHIAEHSLNKNKTFCFNLSAMFLIDFFYDQLCEAISYADIVFGNESEALKLSEKSKFQTTDMKEIAKKISEMPYKSSVLNKKRVVIITQGELPVIVVSNGNVLEFPVNQMETKNIVDTNGAGDAFVGGFLSKLVEGKSLNECIVCGQKTAQLIIQRSGCTFPDNVPEGF